MRNISSVYGPLIDFYEEQGFVRCITFKEKERVGEIEITAIPVDRGDMQSFIYVFEKRGKRIIYAPCDIKPFPENRQEIRGADLLIIQPGIFESSLKHAFIYPEDHISRTTLYTFEETLAIARKIRAEQVLFVHLEEYWNRTYDDYLALEKEYDDIRFAYDGMRIIT